MKQKAVIRAIMENFVTVECNGKINFKVGDMITLQYGETRSLTQNAFYWQYLTFVIEDCDLKDWGFFTPEVLHEALKAHFLSTKEMNNNEWKVIEMRSTTELTKDEFVKYLEKIDFFINDFFKTDTSLFWREYYQEYGK